MLKRIQPNERAAYDFDVPQHSKRRCMRVRETRGAQWPCFRWRPLRYRCAGRNENRSRTRCDEHVSRKCRVYFGYAARYKASRRRHPLCDEGMTIAQGITAERALLYQLRVMAQDVVNTTDMLPL